MIRSSGRRRAPHKQAPLKDVWPDLVGKWQSWPSLLPLLPRASQRPQSRSRCAPPPPVIPTSGAESPAPWRATSVQPPQPAERPISRSRLHDNAARPLAQWRRTVLAAGFNGSKARCLNLSLWFYLLSVIKKMRAEFSSLRPWARAEEYVQRPGEKFGCERCSRRIRELCRSAPWNAATDLLLRRL